MKHVPTLLSLSCLFLFSFISLTQATVYGPTDPLGLVISTNKMVYHVGEDIVVTASLINTSDRTLLVTLAQDGPGELNYTPRVEDGENRTTPPTPYGQTLKLNTGKSPATNLASKPIKPFDVVENKVTVNKIFQMSVPGKYTIDLNGSIKFARYTAPGTTPPPLTSTIEFDDPRRGTIEQPVGSNALNVWVVP